MLRWPKLLEGQRGCAEGIVSDAEKLDECRKKLPYTSINLNSAGPDARAAGVPSSVQVKSFFIFMANTL